MVQCTIRNRNVYSLGGMLAARLRKPPPIHAAAAFGHSDPTTTCMGTFAAPIWSTATAAAPPMSNPPSPTAAKTNDEEGLAGDIRPIAIQFTHYLWPRAQSTETSGLMDGELGGFLTSFFVLLIDFSWMDRMSPPRGTTRALWSSFVGGICYGKPPHRAGVRISWPEGTSALAAWPISRTLPSR